MGILKDYGMIETKHWETLIIPNVKLKPDNGDPLEDPKKYRGIVGKLKNLTLGCF